jgi:peptidoglycan/LPS O-acetylase OafA/YrhL
MAIDGQTSITEWSQPTKSAVAAIASYPIVTKAVLVLSNIWIFGSDFLLAHSILPDGAFVPRPSEGIPGYRFMLFPPAWTLAVELCFYAIAPLLMMRRHLLTIIVGCVAPFAFRYALPGPTGNFNLAYCEAGMVAYFIYKKLPKIAGTRYAGFAMTAATMLFAISSNYLPGNNQTKVTIFVTMTWVMVPFAFAASHDLRLDRRFGNASYGMYVAHFAVYKLLAILTINSTRPIIYFPVLLIAGLLISQFIELPFDALRERIAKRRSSATARKPLHA